MRHCKHFIEKPALIVLLAAALATGCAPQGQPPAAPPTDVTVIQVAPRDVPLTLQYVGRAESSRSVEIRARVDGYLLKRFYREGVVVRKGDPLFQIDPAPLQVATESAAATLKERESRLQDARRVQERLKRLLTESAVSKKDVEDAVASTESAGTALAISQADLAKARMNQSYAYITSPLTGLAARSNLAEGSYINPAANGLLTTVAQIDPIWVNFSISENEWQRLGEEAKQGRLRFPDKFDFDVQMELSDGRTLGSRGQINFAAPSVDPQTGTYAVRASFPNADLSVRPGQFVRVRLNGAWRPGAILVPQRAVMQGQSGKFVYVVTSENKAEIRPVQVGDWHGDEWFITGGLQGGERIVVGGIVKVQPGAALKISPEPVPVKADAASAAGK